MANLKQRSLTGKRELVEYFRSGDADSIKEETQNKGVAKLKMTQSPDNPRYCQWIVFFEIKLTSYHLKQ